MTINYDYYTSTTTFLISPGISIFPRFFHYLAKILKHEENLLTLVLAKV